MLYSLTVTCSYWPGSPHRVIRGTLSETPTMRQRKVVAILGYLWRLSGVFVLQNDTNNPQPHARKALLLVIKPRGGSCTKHCRCPAVSCEGGEIAPISHRCLESRMESSADAGSIPASNGPDGPGQLVGLPYHYVVGPAFEQRLQPRACGCFVAFERNRSCCMHQQRSQIYVPTFADAHCRTRPLVQLGRGTNSATLRTLLRL